MISLLFKLIGFFLIFILFYHYKTLNTKKDNNTEFILSIIIPARNEEVNLSTLLSCLQKQTVQVGEIILVNDRSEDRTEEIASSFGCKVISLDHSPTDWKGKNYACFVGAKQATGDTLLFLDADLILKPDAIEKLLCSYEDNSVLSVQPYHYTEKPYEQLSLFFNAITIAAVGICLPGRQKSIGLFGPVLMMSKKLYSNFGGHELVKAEVLEDYVLGHKLRQMGIRCNLFLGYDSISYQMYKGGFWDLVWGWSKNFASGAAGTPFFYLLPVFLWLSAYYAIAIDFIKQLFYYANAAATPQSLILQTVIYLFTGIVLFFKLRKIGRFPLVTCLLYFIPLAGFTMIFFFSLILKFVMKRVKWKGRWHRI